jgi:hypothetical protein
MWGLSMGGRGWPSVFPGFEELEIRTAGTTIRGRRGLRGFGHSAAPASTPDHAPYAMREPRATQLEVTQQLGYERFGVAGHDRGGRCAYRRRRAGCARSSRRTGTRAEGRADDCHEALNRSLL